MLNYFLSLLFLHNGESVTTSQSTGAVRVVDVLTHNILPLLLDRQFSVPPPPTRFVEKDLQIRPYDRDIPREAPNSREEVTKEHEDTIELDQKANQRPSQEDEGDAGREGRCAFKLLPSREKDCRLLQADDKNEADDE